VVRASAPGAPLATTARRGGETVTFGHDADPERTADSVEQVDDATLPNPITDEGELGEAGDALNPEGEAPTDDKDDAEGPVPHTTQMPR
jgi:hypothetical protein